MNVDFDEKAKEWDADPTKIERARAIAEGIKKRVPLSPDMSAFEYGCGTGLLSFALKPYLARFTLADSSTGMLKVLEEKIAVSGFRNMTPMKLDLMSDPLPSERYQLIYTMMTLHHIPDTGKILRDFYELLKSPGYLCVADLDEEDGSFHGPEFEGHKGFGRKVLGDSAERVGFRSPSFTTVYRMSKGTGESRKDYPIFLMIAEKK